MEYYDRTSGRQRGVTGDSGGVDLTKLASERNIGTSNEYGVGVGEYNYTSWAHGDGDTIITSSPALLLGVFVNAALTGDVAVRDGTTASGTLILTSGSTVNTFYGMPGNSPIKLNSGIFLDDNATAGNVLVVWRPQ